MNTAIIIVLTNVIERAKAAINKFPFPESEKHEKETLQELLEILNNDNLNEQLLELKDLQEPVAEKSAYMQAKEGNMNPLEAYLILRGQAEELDEQLKEIKELAEVEVDKNPGKQFEFMGCLIMKKALPGKWDFSSLTQWQTLKAKLKATEEFAKTIYKQLEAGQEVNAADEEGVVINVPTYTPGKDSFTVNAVKK